MEAYVRLSPCAYMNFSTSPPSHPLTQDTHAFLLGHVYHAFGDEVVECLPSYPTKAVDI
jgi:hypothetical protein